jgi:hypothetical protein
MPRKGYSPEQVLNRLRQVEVAVAGGKSVGQAVREIGVTDHTYFRELPFVTRNVSLCSPASKS